MPAYSLLASATRNADTTVSVPSGLWERVTFLIDITSRGTDKTLIVTCEVQDPVTGGWFPLGATATLSAIAKTLLTVATPAVQGNLRLNLDAGGATGDLIYSIGMIANRVR